MKEKGDTKPVFIQSAFNQTHSQKVNNIFPSEIHQLKEQTILEDEQSLDIIINDALDIENVVDTEYRRMFESTSKDTTIDDDSKLARNGTSVLKLTLSAIRKFAALGICTGKKESCDQGEANRKFMKDASTTYEPSPLQSDSFSDRSTYDKNKYNYFQTHDKKLSYVDTEHLSKEHVGSNSAQWQRKVDFKHSRKNSSFSTIVSNVLFSNHVEPDGKVRPIETAKKSVNKEEPHEAIFKRFFSFKKKSKDKSKNLLNSFSGVQVTANHCEVTDSMVFTYDPKNPSKANKPNKSQYEITKAAWLMKYVTTRIESRNSVHIRWSNSIYDSNSSSTEVELMENIQGKRLSLTPQRKEYNTDDFSHYKSGAQFTQLIYAYMMPSIFYDPYTSHNNVLTASRHRACVINEVTNDRKRYDYINDLKVFSNKEVMHSENILIDREVSLLKIDIPKSFVTKMESDVPQNELTNERVVCIVDYEGERFHHNNSKLRPKMSDAGDYGGKNTDDISVVRSIQSVKVETYDTIIKRLSMNREGIGPIMRGNSSLIQSAAQTHEQKSQEAELTPEPRLSGHVCEFAPRGAARKRRGPRYKVHQKSRGAARNSYQLSKCYIFLEPLSSTESRWRSAYSSHNSVLSSTLPQLASPISDYEKRPILLTDEYSSNDAMPPESSAHIVVDDKIILPVVQSRSAIFMSTKDKSGKKKYYAATYKRKSKWIKIFGRNDKPDEVSDIKTEGISFLSSRTAMEAKCTICRPLTVNTSVGAKSPLRKKIHQRCRCGRMRQASDKSTHVSHCKCSRIGRSFNGESTLNLDGNCRQYTDKGINTDGRILVTKNELNEIKRKNDRAKKLKNKVAKVAKECTDAKQKRQFGCSKVCPIKKNQCKLDRSPEPTTPYNVSLTERTGGDQQSQCPDDYTALCKNLENDIENDDNNVCCKCCNNHYKEDKKNSFQAPLPILIKHESSQEDLLSASDRGCCCCTRQQREINNYTQEKESCSVRPLPQELFPMCRSENSNTSVCEEKQNELSVAKNESDDYETVPYSVSPLPIPLLQGPFPLCRNKKSNTDLGEEQQKDITEDVKKQDGCLKRQRHLFHPLPLPVLQEPLPMNHCECCNTNLGKHIEFSKECAKKVTPKSSEICIYHKTKKSIKSQCSGLHIYTDIYKSQKYSSNADNIESKHDKSTGFGKNSIVTNHGNDSYTKSPSSLAIFKDDSSSFGRLPTETAPLIEKLYTSSLNEVYFNNREIEPKSTDKANDHKSIQINLQFLVKKGHNTEFKISRENKKVCKLETNKTDSNRYNNPKKELNIRILIKNKNYHKKGAISTKYKNATTDTDFLNEFARIAFEDPNNYVHDKRHESSHCWERKPRNLWRVKTLSNRIHIEVTKEENTSTNKQLAQDTGKVSDESEIGNVLESSAIMQAPRKNRAVAPINEAEILQTYQIKQAVLDIYDE